MNIGLYDVLREDARIHWLSARRAALGIGHPGILQGLGLVFFVGVTVEDTANAELGDLLVR